MTASLRHVDPTRPPGALVRAYSALGTTQLARFISRHVNWKLDPFLLRLTRGRLASTLMVPSAVPGAATHPAWYPNLRAGVDLVAGVESYIDSGEILGLLGTDGMADCETGRRLIDR